jgi:hypothetical protein
MKIKQSQKVLLCLCLAAASLAASPKPKWETWGDTKILISPNQQQAYAIKFYQNRPTSYFNGCSAPIRQLSTVVGVEYQFRNEVKSFSIRDPKWGSETFEADNSTLPEARKWIMSTIIAEGRQIYVTSRGCGSGVIPYLISVERR